MDVTENDMLDLFETAGGDLGAYIGGRTFATEFAAITLEAGPYTSAFAGALGYAGGSVIGRNYGEESGRELFYYLAKPGYEAYWAVWKLNNYIENQNNPNPSFYPY